MFGRSRLAGAVLALAALSACADESARAPQDVFAPRFAVTGCNFQGSLGWFTDNTQRQQAQTIASNLQSACGTASVATYAWQLLARLDIAFNSHLGGTASSGAVLANNLIACIESGPAYDCAGTPQPVEEKSLAQAGLFRVVGNDNLPAVARDPITLADGVTGLWGVEPSNAAFTWLASANHLPDGQALIHGGPADIDTEVPQPLTPDYDVHAYPATATPFDPQLRIAVCFSGLELDGSLAPLILHDGSTLLQTGEQPTFCGDAGDEVETSFLDRLRSLVAAAGRMFVSDAYAAAMQFLIPPSATGNKSDFSKFKGVASNASGARLEFVDQPPAIIAADAPFTFVVKALSDEGPAVSGVLTEAFVCNNKGVPAGAVFVDGPTLTETTDATGKATFTDAAIGKKGGYTVCVRAIDATQTTLIELNYQEARSNSFHIR